MTNKLFFWLGNEAPSYAGQVRLFLEGQGWQFSLETNHVDKHVEQWKSKTPKWLVISPEQLEAVASVLDDEEEAVSAPQKASSEAHADGVLLTQVKPKAKAVNLEQSLKKLKNQAWSKDLQVILLLESHPTDKDVSQWLRLGVSGIVYQQDVFLAVQNDLLHILHHYRQRQELQWHNDEMFNLSEELRNRSLDMEKELEKTRILQLSLLPAEVQGGSTSDYNPYSYSKLHYTSETSQIHGLYLPCEAIGGDLYDMITFQDGSLGILMNDVSGHGIPAAFVTAMVKSSFYRITHHHQSPDQVLFHLNNQLADVVKTGEYSTAIYLHLDESTRTLQFAGAGHPYPYHYHAKTGEVSRLEENGTPLVWVPNMPYAMQELTLEAGDKVLLFTDGISELQNTQDEMFGEDRLNILFKGIINEGNTGGDILDSMLAILSDFTEGQPLGDDMTMLLLEIK
ncbi:MAG: PP2C family protein-serine/threonine phosphatase [Vampirovibrionales bacterium]